MLRQAKANLRGPTCNCVCVTLFVCLSGEINEIEANLQGFKLVADTHENLAGLLQLRKLGSDSNFLSAPYVKS